MKNIINDVMISPESWERWHVIAQNAAKCLPPGTTPYDIPDEQIIENPDGTLTVFCRIPGKTITMIIPENEWSWKN